MPISPSPVVNEFLATKEQVLELIPRGNQYIAHSAIINGLKRHTTFRQCVNDATVCHHLELLLREGIIDQTQRKVDVPRPKMEMHYRRRVGH